MLDAIQQRSFKLLLLAAIAFVVCVYVVVVTRSASGESKLTLSLATEKALWPAAPKSNGSVWAELKRCVVDGVTADFRTTAVDVINGCVRRLTSIRADAFDTFNMGRFDEKKYFLRPASALFANCSWLTVGIGGTAVAEGEAKRKYPQCRIFGVEPKKDQVADFARYGTIIPHAVGVKRDKLSIRVRTPKGGYVVETAEIWPLADLLDRFVGGRRVALATVDIEGFEYRLLPAFERGAAFDRAAVVLCQMDVELHDAHTSASVAGAHLDFAAFIGRFLTRSPYVPVFATNFLSHVKMTLVHESDADCARMFAFDKLVP